MGITAALRLVALFVKCGRGSQERRGEAPWGSEGRFYKAEAATGREGMKNMIYIIAVYCCYLVAARQGRRHFYEEGIDRRARAALKIAKGNTKTNSDRKSLKHTTRNFKGIECPKIDSNIVDIIFLGMISQAFISNSSG